MDTVSKVMVKGKEYDIKDAVARESTDDLQSRLSYMETEISKGITSYLFDSVLYIKNPFAFTKAEDGILYADGGFSSAEVADEVLYVK